MLFAFCFCFCFHCFVYLLFSLISLVGYGGCCAHRTLTIFSMFIFVFIFFYFASPSCWISIVNDQRTFVIVSTLFFFSFAFLLLVRLNCFILPNGLSIPTAYTTKPKQRHKSHNRSKIIQNPSVHAFFRPFFRLLVREFFFFHFFSLISIFGNCIFCMGCLLLIFPSLLAVCCTFLSISFAFVFFSFHFNPILFCRIH